MMKITVGILAWNEASTIKTTLHSLLEQSIFNLLNELEASLDLICIPNGSTDRTTEIIKDFFLKIQPVVSRNVKCLVKEISEAGKANAWNILVHEVADKNTDYFFLVDADIQMENPDTLYNMLTSLIQNPLAVVSTDTPKKHIAFKRRKSPFDFFQERIATLTQNAKGQICGQLYCMRGSFAQKTWMPRGLIIEDGFLKELVVTNFLREPPNQEKIVRAENASHIFTACTGIKEIYHHQLRQTIGQSINFILTQWLKDRLHTLPLDGDLGHLIHKQNLHHPAWLHQLVNDYSKTCFWALYPHSLTFRFRRLKNVSLIRKVLFFPISLSAFFFDLPIFFIANYRLKNMLSLQHLWADKSQTT